MLVLAEHTSRQYADAFTLISRAQVDALFVSWSRPAYADRGLIEWVPHRRDGSSSENLRSTGQHVGAARRSDISRMRAVLWVTAPVGLRVSFARLVRYFRRLPCCCVLPQPVVTVRQYHPVEWSM
jgi:hypothetical protein